MNKYQKEHQIIEWLKDYYSYKGAIENLERVIEDIAESNMGVNFGKESSGGTNKFSSTVEDAAIRIDEKNLRSRIHRMQNVVDNVDKALEILTDIERAVVINRCMKGEYYYQFCYKIGASERTTKRIKKEALRKMSIVIFGLD